MQGVEKLSPFLYLITPGVLFFFAKSPLAQKLLFIDLFVFFFVTAIVCMQIRRVTVLFVNLGLKDQTLLAAAVYDEAMEEMHKVGLSIAVRHYSSFVRHFNSVT